VRQRDWAERVYLETDKGEGRILTGLNLGDVLKRTGKVLCRSRPQLSSLQSRRVSTNSSLKTGIEVPERTCVGLLVYVVRNAGRDPET
jgi:hypothetical protein